MLTRSLRFSALLLTMTSLIATASGCILDGSSSAGADDAAAKPIPRRAAVVREGRGMLEYTADADGEIYIQDAKTEATILSRRTKRGDTITVFPNEDRIRLHGDTTLKIDLKRANDHRIYLLRDSTSNDDSTSARNARDGVPVGARLIGEDTNNVISFKADRAGRAYIVDADDHKLVETVAVAKNQRFTFSPAEDSAAIDGRPAVERDFSTRTNYRIYFDH